MEDGKFEDSSTSPKQSLCFHYFRFDVDDAVGKDVCPCGPLLKVRRVEARGKVVLPVLSPVWGQGEGRETGLLPAAKAHQGWGQPRDVIRGSPMQRRMFFKCLAEVFLIVLRSS